MCKCIQVTEESNVKENVSLLLCNRKIKFNLANMNFTVESIKGFYCLLANKRYFTGTPNDVISTAYTCVRCAHLAMKVLSTTHTGP